MNGVTWSERREGWWLASNGRWYSPEHYPGGWSMTALPPAPEHRGRKSAASMITSRTKRLRASVADALEDGSKMQADSSAAGRQWSSTGSTRRPPPPPPSTGGTPVRAGGGTAGATVTSSTSYASRLPAGMPTAQALEAGEDDYPDPPGRISDDAADLDQTA